MYNNIQLVLQVRRKGHIVQGRNPNIIRKDDCGAWIKFQDYGNRKSQYGREIDHIIPDSLGGPDKLSNYRPLQWRNNLTKSNGRLTCPVKAKQYFIR